MNITNEKLYELCKKYGAVARFWRQKFIGLLPEVNKRQLYKEKDFSSIFEFAAKLAGVSEEQVNRVLHLERKFQDKPDLHRALINGEVSLNKLRKIVSIATPENQESLLEQVKILSQKAVETLTRDEKMVRSGRATMVYDQMPILQGLQLPSEPILSNEVKAQLFELQQKGIDINEIILEALERRKMHIENEKRRLADEQDGKESTRHIPVKIERILNLEYGTKCAVPNCLREADQIHHELPFAMVKNHNPFCMKPLCKEHHEIAHGIDLKYQRMKGRPEIAFLK